MISLTLIPERILSNKLQRSCGECTVCCTYFKIPEVNKPAWSDCKHICAEGCGIYETRPSPCQQFQCLYLAGNVEGDVGYRPDNLGVLLYTSNGDEVIIVEIRPNALHEPKVRYMIEKIAKTYKLAVAPYNGG